MIRIGDVIGRRFRVESELGREGDEIVWGAFDTKLERRVAIHRLVSDPDALRKTQRIRALETFVFGGDTWLVSERRKRRKKRSHVLPVAVGAALAGGVLVAMYLGTRPPTTRATAPVIATASASSASVVSEAPLAPPIVDVVDAAPAVTAAATKAPSNVIAMMVFGGGRIQQEELRAWFDAQQPGLTKCLRKYDCAWSASFAIRWSTAGRQVQFETGQCASKSGAESCIRNVVTAADPPVQHCDPQTTDCTVKMTIVAH